MRRGIEEGGQSIELMARLTGRLECCDQQVVGDQVAHVTSDADKTGLNNKACCVPGTGLTAISPPFDLAFPLRDLAAAGG